MVQTELIQVTGLTPDQKEQIAIVAEKEHRSVSGLVRHLILDYVESQPGGVENESY